MRFMDENIEPAMVLKALYNHAAPFGLGVLAFDPKPMTLEEARDILKNWGGTYFDYLKGRLIKTDVGAPVLDAGLYDRDYGYGAAERALLDELTKPE